MNITRLKITGMTCEGCNTNIRQALESVSNVEQVMVDGATGSATVTHQAVPPAALIEAVHLAGYGAYTLWDDVEKPLATARA